MQFTITQEFPAGLDRLWAVFGRPDYPRRKYRALGATAVRLRRFRATAQAIEVDLERDVPLDDARLPAWTRLLVRSRQTLRHRTAWRRLGPTQAAAELDLAPLGLPVRARGTARLREEDGATRMTVTWQVHSLLGEAVERLFAAQLRAAAAADHDFTLRYLQEADAA